MDASLGATPGKLVWAPSAAYRGGQDEIKGEKPLAAPVDLRDVERHRRGGAGRVEGKGHSKKKGCPKDDLPEKPVRSSL